MPAQESVREQLREIAHTIQHAAGPGQGFAFFLDVAGEVHYGSNGAREDVVTALEEWLDRTEEVPETLNTTPRRPSIPETSEAVDARLALERRGAEIGKLITQVCPVTLFLFDIGEGGAFTYFTSMPNARNGVRSWVRSMRKLKS